MNAVERLLAHGERAVGLFDDVYREADLGPLWDEAEPVARRVVELLDLEGGWHGWQSRAFLAVAVARALAAKPHSGRPAEALRMYRELLAERRRLLGPKQVEALLAKVVAASPAWGSLSRDVVLRAEDVAESIGRLRRLPRDPSPWGLDTDRLDASWQRLRRPLRRALGRLRAIKHPPTAEARQKPGNPPHRPMVDADLQRELRDGWRNFKRRYDGDGKPTKAQYIAERCKGQRKGAAEQAALETRMLRTLETALANYRRKHRQLRAARAK